MDRIGLSIPFGVITDSRLRLRSLCIQLYFLFDTISLSSIMVLEKQLAFTIVQVLWIPV